MITTLAPKENSLKKTHCIPQTKKWEISLSLNEQGVCHTVALPFTLKSILRQKKNYGNSNISQCKKYNLQKIL